MNIFRFVDDTQQCTISLKLGKSMKK